MNATLILNGCLVAASVALGTFVGINNANAAPQNQADVEEGVQVLTRGPVHEAFAETISFDPEPGIIVSKQPPEAIEEVPPEQRPAGDNVAWIPGYLAWDDEREDFLWVSGIWRDLPPGRQWMPGYWTESESGYQWISGYWADATQTEIQYLPEPPATAEVGPNIAAPSHDHNWLPGCWIWQQNRYAWRPGYWAPMQPDWDWVPAHYVWSPRGCVFVDGYYDYSVSRRGVLFAPVYLNSGVYSRRGYSYSPSTVIDLRWFTAHLFSRPQYHHYYFGDYYASNYSTAGYYPWFSYGSSGYGYDPFYARQRWDNRQNRDWQDRIERDFAHRRDHEDQRPPRTLAALMERNQNAPQSDDKSLVVAMSLDQLSRNQESPQRFQVIDQSERQALAKRREEMQKFRNERQKLETATTAIRPGRSTDPNKPSEPENVKLPRSPVVSAAVERPGKGVSPPMSPDIPKVDPNVKAKSRIPREAKPNPENAKGSQKRPGTDTKPPAATKTPGAEPRSGKKGDSKSKGVKTDPMPDVPKVDPKPEVPKVNPKPGTPVVPKSDLPKGEPKPKRGKADPKPVVPKAEPKPDVPKAEPKPPLPKVKPTKPPIPVVPKAEPKPDVPKAEPKPPLPKVKPTKPPIPAVPKSEPKPGLPKAKPKPALPKAEPTKPPKP
jgi:hypothetical protein